MLAEDAHLRVGHPAIARGIRILGVSITCSSSAARASVGVYFRAHGVGRGVPCTAVERSAAQYYRQSLGASWRRRKCIHLQRPPTAGSGGKPIAVSEANHSGTAPSTKASRPNHLATEVRPEAPRAPKLGRNAA